MRVIPPKYALKNPEFVIDLLDNFPPRDMDEELCDWIIKQIRKDES